VRTTRIYTPKQVIQIRAILNAMFRVLISAFVFLLSTNVFAADNIYRWVDENGRIHFGDRADPKNADDISSELQPNVVKSNTPKDIKFPALRRGQDITASVIRDLRSGQFPMTVYRLLPPLLPKGRLLHIVRRKDALWFASDIGLISFYPKEESWQLFNKRNGLPGDTAYNITSDRGRLFLQIYDRTKNNSLGNNRQYWFDVEQGTFEKTRKTIDQVNARGSYTPKNSDALGYDFQKALFFKNRLWLTYTHIYDKNRTRQDGGVVALHPINKRGRQFTTRHGLAHGYVYDITASKNDSVWVTHWEEERGISYLNNGNNRWRVIKKSKNGIELGGVRIAAVDQFILIGQQRALVIYDRDTKLAYSINEADGLPGYIVSDILVDGNDIWVTAYGYARGGSDRGGLVHIKRDQLKGFFQALIAAEKETNKEKRELRQAQ